MSEHEFVKELQALGFKYPAGGFPRGFLTREDVEVFSTSQRAMIGGTGGEWKTFEEVLATLSLAHQTLRVRGTIERKHTRRPLVVLKNDGGDCEPPLLDEWEDGDTVEITVRRVRSL